MTTERLRNNTYCNPLWKGSATPYEQNEILREEMKHQRMLTDQERKRLVLAGLIRGNVRDDVRQRGQYLDRRLVEVAALTLAQIKAKQNAETD
jgi:hypothetical protein